MNGTRIALAPSVLLLLGVSALGAQDLEELCPNSRAENGAIQGIVSDVDTQMMLPGVTVRATWEKDGTPGHGDTQTGLDGRYTMCYLPLQTHLSLLPMLGNMAGEAVSLTLTEPITRQDILFSLTGGGDAEEDRIWACIGPPDSQIRIQLGSLVRCEPQWPPLEQCPKKEMGKVYASTGTRGRGAMREMVERLVDEARRLGANALINVSGGRGSIDALAVRIEVDPSSC
jgi:hypothetical protein